MIVYVKMLTDMLMLNMDKKLTLKYRDVNDDVDSDVDNEIGKLRWISF